MHFDRSVLCFHLGRWRCLHVEFYALRGTPIVETVVLRSGSCGTLLQKFHIQWLPSHFFQWNAEKTVSMLWFHPLRMKLCWFLFYMAVLKIGKIFAPTIAYKRNKIKKLNVKCFSLSLTIKNIRSLFY